MLLMFGKGWRFSRLVMVYICLMFKCNIGSFVYVCFCMLYLPFLKMSTFLHVTFPGNFLNISHCIIVSKLACAFP